MNKKEIKQMIMDVASAAIEYCCKNTSYGQYDVCWEDIQGYISKENYEKYYHDIIEELWTREEVLDVYDTSEMTIDLNCGGNWCSNLEECDANEDIWHEPSETLPVTWVKFEEEVLTQEQLWKLRKEIVLNSLYYKDYKNSFGIDRHDCCDFFDGYCDYLEELMIEDGHTDNEFFELLSKYDTVYNLSEWYSMFDENPLPIKIKEENENA